MFMVCPQIGVQGLGRNLARPTTPAYRRARRWRASSRPSEAFGSSSGLWIRVWTLGVGFSFYWLAFGL